VHGLRIRSGCAAAELGDIRVVGLGGVLEPYEVGTASNTDSFLFANDIVPEA
jgi:hypothetical protein